MFNHFIAHRDENRATIDKVMQLTNDETLVNHQPHHAIVNRMEADESREVVISATAAASASAVTAPSTGDESLAELADRVAATVDTRDREARAARHSGALATLLESLNELRAESDAATVLDRAPRVLCRTRIFDRVMFSRVQLSTWLPQALYALDVDGIVITEIDGVVEKLEIPLTSPLVEAEVVRRRLPALVQDARDEPRAHQPLVERTGTTEYVVAPVVVGTTVIGLLHADTCASGRELTTEDRDLLRMFTDGVGLIYERAQLAARVERQREHVAEACEAAVQSMAVLQEGAAVELGTRAVTAAPPQTSLPSTARAWSGESRESSRVARLTAREREVLALLASGATNAQLADRLTVAESTVKSHVKHILHKLGAGNRAAAISCYLRETQSDDRRSR